MAKDMWRRKWHADTLVRHRHRRTQLERLDRQVRLLSKWASAIHEDQNAAVAAAERSAEIAAKAMKGKEAGKAPAWGE